MPNASIPKGNTPDSRENYLISLAMDEAERRLKDGSATSQEVCHFLRLASSKERLEKEVLTNKCQLLQAQVESLKQAAQTEEMYRNAIEAMTSYQTHSNNEEDYDDYDEFEE